MPGCWILAGLEWIGGGDGGDRGIGVDARTEEGIGINSHTLELQELFVSTINSSLEDRYVRRLCS